MGRLAGQHTLLLPVELDHLDVERGPPPAPRLFLRAREPLLVAQHIPTEQIEHAAPVGRGDGGAAPCELQGQPAGPRAELEHARPRPVDVHASQLGLEQPRRLPDHAASQVRHLLLRDPDLVLVRRAGVQPGRRELQTHLSGAERRHESCRRQTLRRH